MLKKNEPPLSRTRLHPGVTAWPHGSLGEGGRLDRLCVGREYLSWLLAVLVIFIMIIYSGL